MCIASRLARGQIWWYDDGIDKTTASFDDTVILVGMRPVLVIAVSSYVTIVPFTSAQSYSLNSDIHLNIVPDMVSILRTDQIQTVKNDDKFIEYMGAIDSNAFNSIIDIVLDIIEENCPYEVNYTTDINKNDFTLLDEHHEFEKMTMVYKKSEDEVEEDIGESVEDMPEKSFTEMVITDAERAANALNLSRTEKENFVKLNTTFLKSKYPIFPKDIEKYKNIFKYQLRMQEKIKFNKLEADDIKNIFEQPAEILAARYGITVHEINNLKKKVILK